MSLQPDPSPPEIPDQEPEPAAEPQAVAARPGWLPATSRRRILDVPAGETGDGSAPSGTPTPPATDPAADKKLFGSKSKTFATIAEAGLEALGGILNGFLAAGPEDPVFLPDDDDLNTVPPPLGRIIARRVKMSEDTNLSEAADMMTAGIGLAAWLAKGLIGLAQARLARRHPAAAPAGAVPGEVIYAEAGQ